MEVTADRESLLLLLRDYLEKTGMTATLAALEAEAELASLSPGLAAVRRLALGGRWRELEQTLLVPHEDREEHELFKRARYSLAKQQYLEAVATLDSAAAYREPSEAELDEIRGLLERLEQLAPSRDDYSSLLALSESTTDFFNGWSLQKARKETCGDLLAWCRADCFREREEKTAERESGSGDMHQLTLLLVKGKIYEHCEQLFAKRCQSLGTGVKKSGIVVDIRGWLLAQPDSVFQVAPRLIHMVETASKPVNARCLGEALELPVKPQINREGAGNGVSTAQSPPPPIVPPPLPTPSKSIQTHSLSPLSPPAAFREPVSATAEPHSLGQRISEHRECVETATDKLRQSLRSEEEERGDRESSSEGQTSQQAPTVCQTDSPPGQTHQGLTFNDNFGSQPVVVESTPHQGQAAERRGKKSSTPKPAAQRLISPPLTSPVPHLPATRFLTTPSGWSQCGLLSEKKQIDFDQEAMTTSWREDTPLAVSWPCATLIAKVEDSQAVRSMAFSESGQLVAVGANSKSLRIFSTDTLLDTTSVQELTAVQELSRHHRGSIYCLAWSGDQLLASGSNDKSIKLLSPQYSSESATTCWESRGRLSSHKGTVREMVFVTERLLASGGSGTPSLLVTDCETMNMASSLSGHEKQVLAVARGCGEQRSTLVSGGEDKTVRLWDLSAGACVHTLTLSEVVTSLSTCSHTLAVATADGSCLVYDMRNWGQQVTSYQPHSDECRSIRHSPSGKWLLSASYDSSVCLGETTGTEWAEVAQHEDKVVQARWHPQGKIFASTSSDKTACFWVL